MCDLDCALLFELLIVTPKSERENRVLMQVQLLRIGFKTNYTGKILFTQEDLIYRMRHALTGTRISAPP
jgi:hypothetical protein